MRIYPQQCSSEVCAAHVLVSINRSDCTDSAGVFLCKVLCFFACLGFFFFSLVLSFSVFILGQSLVLHVLLGLQNDWESGKKKKEE